jgi:hypothetical protein
LKQLYTVIVCLFLLSSVHAAWHMESTEETATSLVFSDTQLVIYPNPVRSEATISYSAEVERVAVLNLVGREVMGFTVDRNAGSIKVDLSQLQPGVYFLTAQSQGRNLVTKRFMKEQ